MRRALNFLIAYVAALSLLVTPAFGQVAPDYSKTGSGRVSVLLAASAAAVIIPSSGSSNASGQITFTTALPATPVGTVGVSLPAGVVTAGTQGTGAGVYQATCSSTTVCTLTGTVTTANGAYTQVLTEIALATVTVPAGAMGANGILVIRTVWTYTNSANAKTLRVRLGGIGGTAFLNQGVTTTAGAIALTEIVNRNSISSQIGGPTGNTQLGAGATTTTGALNIGAAQDIVISGQLALATETIILETYEVWLLP